MSDKYNIMLIDEIILLEYRGGIKRIIDAMYPSWPEYIRRDLLYPMTKQIKNPNEIRSRLTEFVGYMGLDSDSRWTLVPDQQFVMDMWEPRTLQSLESRIGGKIENFVSRDAERHQAQSQILQTQGISKEPCILLKLPSGYELVEGWHRTVQRFKKYPLGFRAPAYIAVSEGDRD